MKNHSIKLNSILNVIKTISTIVFPLITFPYISRILLPENVGKVNFGSSYINYFTMIATLGITTYAIRECSAVRDDVDLLSKRASEIYSINICTTIISYILLALSLIFFKNLENYKSLIIIQSTTIIFVTLGADWLNSAMEDFGYITIRTIFFQLVSLILMFCFVKHTDDYLKYAAISVFSSSGANITNIFYRRRYCKVHLIKDMKWNVHFKPIMYLFVMLLAQTIFTSADVTMLGLMKGDFEVGIYSTALKIQNLVAQVSSSLAWVFIPRLSVLFVEADYDKINSMLKKTLGVLMLMGIPSIVGIWALANDIVIIIGGESFINSAIPLKILMVAFGISLIGGSFLGNMVLLPSKNEKTYMTICCITALVNVTLNYILIPYGGAIAASFTTAVSALLIFILLLLKKDKRIKLNYVLEVSISPIVGSLFIYLYCKLIALFVSALLLRVMISIMGSMIIYGIVLLLMKNELCMNILYSVKGKLRGKLG